MLREMPARTKVGLIFDDGFRKSSVKTAEVFEEFGLGAVLAVIADASQFTPGTGDWPLWNELQNRGHIIHPHGQTHAKLSDLPPQQAIESVQQCFDSFAEHLESFDARRAIYACTYNTGTPEVIEYLLPRVRAVRIGGKPQLSQADLDSRIWTSQAFGPEDPFDDCMTVLAEARRTSPAAVFYCLHGLDGERWGAMTTDHLRQILKLITTAPELEYWDLT